MDFAAIDFETANNDRLSACQVGIARVRRNKVVETYSSLIRPPTQDFYKAYVKLHGITAQRVRKAPTFREVWPEIQSRCGTGLVAAHNAVFDVGILISCAEDCGLGRLPGKYLCTVELARALLPGLPNHKLITLTSVLGIPIDHHDACSDAVACAELAIQLMKLATPELIADYCHDFANFGADSEMNAEFSEACVSISLHNAGAQFRDGNVESVPLVDAAPPDGRFEGKQFVFTGEMTFLGRDESCHIVAAQGGMASNSVSKKTDYLVVGEEVLGAFKRKGETTGKLARAVAIQEAGGSIQIIGAPEFLNMIR
jgi:DNA polymerase-3 subunit epsilon